MSPDERRQAIIEATRPLLVAGGGQFTIKEVAEAAGIAEGTIFRVFDSKQDIIHAVVADVLDTESLRHKIAALPDEPDFTTHLAALISLLTADTDVTHAAFTAARLANCEASPGLAPPASTPIPAVDGTSATADVPAQTQTETPTRTSASTPTQASTGNPETVHNPSTGRHHQECPPPPGHGHGEMSGFQQRTIEVRAAIIASLEPWRSQLRLSIEQCAFLIQSAAFSALHFVFDDTLLSDPALLADTLAHGIYKD
ncbi:TetR/AcrR family transcriptional regulator [Propionimicrobium sp. PCR01-08-3]|uniref:TetR/AcrR family transcriptional regulator n=1 Tax=Propionimicrobium sp. PCR01-08-3 TaxID=3052086 RepID=UPI00255C5E4C|nr:TetR/AcrR family transcriptional regulator [Propionimicrobium sp. PCR01-08-3]WIY82757.1 TetR/AcrR family transcriptional regulator [Propionimicrobium sp. PCR01-08-3]